MWFQWRSWPTSNHFVMCSDPKRKIYFSPLITSHSPRRDKHLLSFGIQSGFTLKDFGTQSINKSSKQAINQASNQSSNQSINQSILPLCCWPTWEMLFTQGMTFIEISIKLCQRTLWTWKHSKRWVVLADDARFTINPCSPGVYQINTPTVRVWDGLTSLSKVQNENTSASVPTHFERLGLWPLKNKISTITLTPTICGYPGIAGKKKKTHSRTVKMKNQGSQLQIACGSHFFVLARASFGSWWHHHHASVLPGQWFGRHFVFPIKMTCMRQLGGWKSIRCCLPCSNVYYI